MPKKNVTKELVRVDFSAKFIELGVEISECTKIQEAIKDKKRGVADIEFKKSDKYKGEMTTLTVYITQDDIEKGYQTIFKFENNGWDPLPGNVGIVDVDRDLGGGYLRALLPIGDPPIAVG